MKNDLLTKESTNLVDSFSLPEFQAEVDKLKTQLDESTSLGFITGLCLDSSSQIARGIALIMDGRLSGILLLMISGAKIFIKIKFRSKPSENLSAQTSTTMITDAPLKVDHQTDNKEDDSAAEEMIIKPVRIPASSVTLKEQEKPNK